MAKKKDEPTAENTLAPTEANTALVEFDYGDDSGRGFENQDSADQSLPFLKLLQGLSPEIEKFDGAKPGFWFNTVTNQLYDRDKGFLFVPATTRHVFAEWVHRDKGGGFRGHHEVESDIVQQAIKRSARFGKYETEEGNQLTETFYVYGAICTEDGYAESPGIIAFWSTKIKAYKQWMTRLRGFTLRTPKGIVRPPLYANLTRIKAGKEKNDRGEFFVPRIESADPRGLGESLIKPNDERFLLAKQVMEMINAGVAKVDYSKQGDVGAEEGGGGDKAFM